MNVKLALSVLGFACATAFQALSMGVVHGAEATAWKSGPIVCYEVPAISNTKRLPTTEPTDGQVTDTLRVVAARGEFEPVSFVVKARQDVKAFEVSASALQGSAGSIPASNIDIKVVKVWYQAGTSWYSYFGDSNRRELVPELLLKDESLVKVDRKTKNNFLRVNGNYQSISYPKSEAKEAFNYLTAPVADAKSLKPAALTKDEYKQFWITVEVPKSANPGVYTSNLNLKVDGQAAGTMKLAVKVLSYELPDPKTYYNLDNDFLVTVYGTGILDMCQRLGIDQKVANDLQLKYFENLRKHNVYHCRSDLKIAYSGTLEDAAAAVKNEVQLIKKAGFKTKPLLSRGWAYPIGTKEPFEDYKRRMDVLIDTLVGEVGHKDIYVTSWDEAGVSRIKVMRPYIEYVRSKGLNIWVTTHKGRHFDLAGYAIGYANHGGWPDQAYADKWHAIGSKVSSYAGPHTGPENPDVFRRMEGLARYKAKYDGSFNYKLFSQLHPTLYKRHKSNVWNDFMGGTFRGFNIAYPTTSGLIDTLAWEGFREGIDDIRYATKLKLVAKEAMDSTNYDAAMMARKALIWLELLDAKSCDLNNSRMEIIGYIDSITSAMEKK